MELTDVLLCACLLFLDEKKKVRLFWWAWGDFTFLLEGAKTTAFPAADFDTSGGFAFPDLCFDVGDRVFTKGSGLALEELALDVFARGELGFDEGFVVDFGDFDFPFVFGGFAFDEIMTGMFTF